MSFALLKGREIYSPRSPQQPLASKLSFYKCKDLVQRLHKEVVLEKHRGCVNTVTWNEAGTLIASGSDDTRCCIWDVQQRQLKFDFHTGHSSNIFNTHFMPCSDDAVIASCARDSQVRVHRVGPSGYVHSRVFDCHQDRCVPASWLCQCLSALTSASTVSISLPPRPVVQM
jgi:WD40 repeat protein